MCKLCVYEYMYRKEIKYLNDVIQLANNVHYRDADPVDHLEMIMAQTRLATVREEYDRIRLIFRRFK